MRTIKNIFIVFIIFLLLTSIIPQVNAEEDLSTEKEVEEPEYNLLDKLLLLLYDTTYQLVGIVPWAKGLFNIPPIEFVTDPKVIELEYLEETTITVGVINKTSGGWDNRQNFNPHILFPLEDYTFEFILPDYLPEGSIIPYFEPDRYIMGTDGDQKTELTLKANLPEDVALPKNIIVFVNVTKWVTGANLYLPPNPIKHPDYTTWFQFFSKLPFWVPNAIGLIGNNPFGKVYSGKRTIENSVHVPIIIKVNRFHEAEIQGPVTSVKMNPDDIKSIPIKIKNLGSHVDTFDFKINLDSESELVVSPPSSITLKPFEESYTTLSVATPQLFNDPGTLHSIEVQAYSIYDNSTVFSSSVGVLTQGVHVSELGAVYGVILLFFLFILIAFFYIRRKKRLEKLGIKPDKPWSIPKEKDYLDSLKEKDKQKYKEVKEMMQEEYVSALLWYKFYCKSKLNKDRKESIFTKITKPIIPKEKKEKPVKKDKKKGVIVKKKEEPIKEKKVEPLIYKRKEIDDLKEFKKKRLLERKKEINRLKKEKALLKAKRQEEKQRKKLQSFT